MTFQKAPPEAKSIRESIQEAFEQARQHPSPTFVRLKDYPASFGKPDEAFVKEWAEKKEKAWAAKRTPTAPERVYDLKESLHIDRALKSRIDSLRAPRIRSDLIARVVRIGRYALDAAINEAVSQKELHPRASEWKPQWSRIANASQEAVAALDELFSAIDPSGKDAEHFAPFIRQSRIGEVGSSKAEYRDAAESALRDARLLVEAKQIIGKLRADTLTRGDALAAIYPSSSQDHQKRAFVRILAEGWIFLTGKMPSKNPDSSKNPFLLVVEAAWLDWLEEGSSDTEAFGDALLAVISSIDDARLNKLRSDGPEWLIRKSPKL
jgi:hypothetical protein